MTGDWIIRWDVKGEEQPTVSGLEAGTEKAVARFGSTGAGGSGSFAVFAGYLFDKTSLLPDSQAPEAACVAQAYQQYGEGLFDLLRGGWALAVWDAQRGQLLAGRDAMGLHPCYYYWDGRLFLLSPDIDRILAQPELAGQCNRVVLAEYLQNTWNAHQREETFYEEVRRVPAAHRLCLNGSRLQVERYWDPLPPGFQWASDAELEGFYPALERAVGRCLVAGADSLGLSGGFDSVSLAILAAGQRDGRPPLQAVSLRFDIGEGDEGERQAAVARSLGMPQVICRVSEILAGLNAVRASLDLSAASPLPVPSLWQSLYHTLLKTASASGLHSLLMGTGGDDLYVVDVGYSADRLAALDLPALWRYYRAVARTAPVSPLHIARNIFWRYGAKALLFDGLRSALQALSPEFSLRFRSRRLAFPAWLAPADPELRAELCQRVLFPPPVQAAPGEGHYVAALRRLTQSSHAMFQLEQSRAWAGQVGFRLLYPYFDRDLVELSLRMPPERLIADGYYKTPLRRLVSQRFPGVRLPAKKVEFTQTYAAILRGQGLAVWRELGEPRGLSDLGLVEPAPLARLVEDYFAGRNEETLLTWKILSAECWLRSKVK